MTIEEKLVNKLIEKEYKISTAESLTGGLISATIVNVANASKVLSESYVTYHDEAKIKILNVSEKTIKKYNVVSEEVAKEMVLGLKQITNSDICLSVTGMAGPSSDGIIEVGTVAFGFYIDGNIYTTTKFFGNIGRNEVRRKTVEFSLSEALRLIELDD